MTTRKDDVKSPVQEAVAIRLGGLISHERLGRKAQKSFSIFCKLTDSTAHTWSIQLNE